MANYDVIVMGGSYGAIDAFQKLVYLLPDDFPAALFIVQHISAEGVSYLPEMLSRAGKLKAVQARNGMKFRRGTIYVAPPNLHLLVKEDHVSTPMGPRENRMRPSIDVLFRSASVYHNNRVAAVLFSGYQDDGVSGLEAVKRCGGVSIVQDPTEALASDLPENAIKSGQADYILPITGIAAKLSELVYQAVPAGEPAIPEELEEEVKISEYPMDNMEWLDKNGERAPVTCPECGGIVWKLSNESIDRYICHTGHSFSARSLMEGQAETMEYALWAAVRMMSERAKIFESMIRKEEARGKSVNIDKYRKTLEELRMHSQTIRKFIVSGALSNNFEEKQI